MPFLLNARGNLLKNMVGALSCGKSCPYLAIPLLFSVLYQIAENQYLASFQTQNKVATDKKLK